MAETSRTGAGGVAEDAAVTGDRLGPTSRSAPDPARIAGGVAEDLKGAAVGLRSAAVEQGRALYESAKGQAASFADQRKDDAAQSVADLATTLRDTGRTFDDRPNIQAFVGSAADGLDQLAGNLRDRSFVELYGEVERYARRSPIAVAAGAAIVGFLVARFIKSSAEDLAEQTEAARSEQARRRRSAPAYDA